MNMKKKVAIGLLSATMLAGSVPVLINPAFADTSADQLYEKYSPEISKEEHNYAVQLLKDTKIDLSNAAQGKIVVTWPKTTSDYFTIAQWDVMNNDVSHGGKTVTMNFDPKKEIFISLAVERKEGICEQFFYTWSPSDKKLNLTSTNADTLKEYDKTVKEQAEWAKQYQTGQPTQTDTPKQEAPKQEQPKQEAPKKVIPKIPSVDTHGLTDIQGHWAMDSIISAVEKGIVSGYMDKTFRPNNQITRAEFIRMIVSGLKVPASDKKTGLVDDKEANWAIPAIQAAVNAGIILPEEYMDKKFQPNRSITREEIAVFVVRAMGLSNQAINPEEVAKLNSSLKDLSKVDGKRVGYVKLANNIDIIAGNPDGTFAPTRSANRAEAVAMLLRAVEKKQEANGTGVQQ